VTPTARVVFEPADGHPLLGLPQLLVELDQIVGYRGERLPLPLFLSSDLVVDLPPFGRDDRLERVLLLGESLALLLQPLQLLPLGIELVQQAEDALLVGPLLVPQSLDLEAHVLGLPGGHAAGEQAGLLLLQLRLQHLQLPFGLIHRQLELTDLVGELGDLLVEGVDLLLGGSVALELGERGAPVEKPVDLEIELLDVQEISEGRYLHARVRVVVPRRVASTARGRLPSGRSPRHRALPPSPRGSASRGARWRRGPGRPRPGLRRGRRRPDGGRRRRWRSRPAGPAPPPRRTT